MKLILASGNKGKLREMRAILSDLGAELVSQAEAGYDLDVEENGDSFLANARIKARAAVEASGLPCIADDSGLVVDALGGQPGIYSARYGGEGLDDARRNSLLLKNMEGKEDRSARFECCIVCMFPDGKEIVSFGEVRGTLVHEPRGQGGFGYDPLFLPEGEEFTMGELSCEKKNRISHRARALADFEKKLREYFDTQNSAERG
ncbi:MAG: RdgB/HAM1 family non-canonical purine NTP pyrophosphatase [Oscillospiraceae bacterium]|nr:RdgB/HAM1 family non-canonical purine NTP pyrophosphatase [Oscillospiraceae bacterium]